MHLAPPCSSFSRARDRSMKTKLRSSDYPGGLPELCADSAAIVSQANRIAENAWSLACFCGKELGAVTLVENPASSYLWPLVDSMGTEGADRATDFCISCCMFGAPYQKEWDEGTVEERRRYETLRSLGGPLVLRRRGSEPGTW